MKVVDPPESTTTATATAAGVEARLWRSPMTDPRALIASFAIHVTLLAVASVIVFRAVSPKETPAPNRTVQAELEPTDNRAEVEPSRSGGGGETVGDPVEVSAEKGHRPRPRAIPRPTPCSRRSCRPAPTPSH